MPCRWFIKSQFENCAAQPAQNHALQKPRSHRQSAKSRLLKRKNHAASSQNTQLTKISLRYQPAKIALRRGLINRGSRKTQRNTRKSKIRDLQNQAAAFKSELKLLEF